MIPHRPPAWCASVLVVGWAAGCGGIVYLDGPADTTAPHDAATAPNSDAGQHDASVGSDGAPLESCPSTPEVLLQSPGTTIDALALGANHVVFSALTSSRRQIETVHLSSRVRSTLVAVDSTRALVGASLGVLGNEALYLSPSPVQARVTAIPLTGGTPRTVFETGAIADEFHEFSLGEEGAIYTIMSTGATLPAPRHFARWHAEQGFVQLGAGDSVGAGASERSRIQAFSGGFMAVASGQAVMGLDSDPSRIRAFATAKSECRAVTRVRPVVAGLSARAIVGIESTCAEDTGTRIDAVSCVVDSETPDCSTPARVLFAASPASRTRVLDFVVLADGAVALVLQDTSGKRLTERVLINDPGGARAIGGEGITGTVDRIDAIATDGTCIYWSETGPEGARLVRVHR